MVLENGNITHKHFYDICDFLNEGDTLTIFIEAMGRVNYSRMIHDRKGITEKVELISTLSAGHEVVYSLKNWDVRLIEAQSVPPKWREAQSNAPGYYKSTFKLKKTGDTFLDMSAWGKGFVWVNGHCLGRFWQVGPQQTLFCPGCWLKKGDNEIIVMDIIGPHKTTVEGLTTPVIDKLRKELLPNDAVVLQTKRRELRNTDSVGNDAAPGAK
mgnify:FL=1